MLPVRVLVCALAIAAAAIPQVRKAAPAKPPAAAASSSLDKAAFEAYLRRLELWPPQVQIRVDDPKPFIRGLDQVNVHLSAGPATKDVTYYVSSDRKTILRGDTFRLDQDPFQPQLDALKLTYQPSFGPEQAPASLVVFSDFECPLCREEAKELREKIPAEMPKDVRVTFVDFPLESIHPWAKLAAIAARCVYRQNGQSFWDYHDWAFEHQSELNAGNLRQKVTEWAKTKRLDADQLGTCIDSRATEGEVDRELAVGRKLQVDSTPTVFLNGRRLVGHIQWQNLSQIIKLELELRKRK